MAAGLAVSQDDLREGEVLELLQEEQSQDDMARASRSVIKTPIFRSPFFYYPFAGVVGSLSAFAVSHVLLGMSAIQNIPILPDALPYLLASSLTGFFIGMSYGLILRHLPKAVLGGLIGFSIALIWGALTSGIAEGLQFYCVDVLQTIHESRSDPIVKPYSGVGIVLRSAAGVFGWMCLGAGVALGPGLLLRSKNLLNIGLIAGTVGGAFGGLVLAVLNAETELVSGIALPVREAAGYGAFGLLVGLMLAAMQLASREAWFIFAKGPIKGKRLVFFQSPITFGSSVSSDIRLGGDPEIDPRHFTLSREGLRWLLTDNETQHGTYVNGHRLHRCLLSDNDVVTVGTTVLKFKSRRKRN